MRLSYAAVALAVAAFAWPATADTPAPALVYQAAGVHGGPVLYLNGPCRGAPDQICAGEIDGLHDVSGGDLHSPNLDIGAGGDGQPGHGPRGTLSLNWDIGREVVISDGHGRPLARFGPGRRITFYVRPRVVRR